MQETSFRTSFRAFSRVSTPRTAALVMLAGLLCVGLGCRKPSSAPEPGNTANTNGSSVTRAKIPASPTLSAEERSAFDAAAPGNDGAMRQGALPQKELDGVDFSKTFLLGDTSGADSRGSVKIGKNADGLVALRGYFWLPQPAENEQYVAWLMKRADRSRIKLGTLALDTTDGVWKILYGTDSSDSLAYDTFVLTKDSGAAGSAHILEGFSAEE